MKQNFNTKINLLFSAVLITAFVICSYFFADIVKTQSELLRLLATCSIFLFFGAILFYATRVGEGRAVTRFSIVTLLALDLPALIVIIISLAPGLPLHDQLTANGIIYLVAAVALGYGIPYTFFSGFEIIVEETENAIVEGGVMSDILSNEADEDDIEAEETEEALEELAAEELIETEETEDSVEKLIKNEKKRK